MKMIWLLFAASEHVTKVAWKKKLTELGDPATTIFIPSSVKVRTKGHPFSKEADSTQRDPSYFEINESKIAIIEKELNKIKKPKRKRSSKEDMTTVQSKVLIES